MKQMNKKKLCAHLRTMLSNAGQHKSDPSTTRRFCREHLFSGSKSALSFTAPTGQKVVVNVDPLAPDRPWFSLVNEGADAFDEFVDEACADPEIGRLVGKKETEDHLEILIRRHALKPVPTDEVLEAEVKSLLKDLRSSIAAWWVTTPVENLHLQVPELRIGNVVFTPSANFEQLLQNAGLAKSAIDSILPLWAQSSAVAHVTVQASKKNAPIQAVDEIDAALNLLRAYSLVLWEQRIRPALGLRGQWIAAVRPSMTAKVGDGENYRLTSEWSKRGYPFLVSVEIIEFMQKKLGLDVFSEALAAKFDSRTEVQQALLTASRWIGRAAAAQSPAEFVLNAIVAVEQLLTIESDGHGDISERVSRRSAYLLAEGFERRLSIFKGAKRLYNLRSEIVHSGRSDVTELEILEVEDFSMSVMCAFSDRAGQWEKLQDFIDWVRLMEFSAPPTSFSIAEDQQPKQGGGENVT